MILNWSDIDIYIKPGATDMRKQINGLSLLVEEEFGEDLFNGTYFYFAAEIEGDSKLFTGIEMAFVYG